MVSKGDKNLKQPQNFAHSRRATEAEENDSPDCKYFFGYLTQRGTGEEVPEDCFECKRVIDCMNTKDIKCPQPNIKDLPEPKKELPDETTETPAINDKVQSKSIEVAAAGPSVILRCEQWEDFQNYASQSKNVSFMQRESDGLFEADAHTKNQIVAYVGKTPKLELLLKIWLSRCLEVPEEKIFEGFVSKT